jgi:hypothetical protein
MGYALRRGVNLSALGIGVDFLQVVALFPSYGFEVRMRAPLPLSFLCVAAHCCRCCCFVTGPKAVHVTCVVAYVPRALHPLPPPLPIHPSAAAAL